MNRLIALYPILYHSTQYKVGEELPANNPEMLEAWIKAGTAGWEKDILATEPEPEPEPEPEAEQEPEPEPEPEPEQEPEPEPESEPEPKPETESIGRGRRGRKVTQNGEKDV